MEDSVREEIELTTRELQAVIDGEILTWKSFNPPLTVTIRKIDIVHEPPEPLTTYESKALGQVTIPEDK